MKQIIKISIIIISILTSTISKAQPDFSQFLPNAQAIGIGGSNVALAADPAACYWNPGSIAFLTTNRVLLNIDNESYLNFIGLTRFFPPALSLGINILRSTYDSHHYDMAMIALGYRLLPFLSFGSSFNFSKTMEDKIYSSLGVGLFFKTVPDYQSRIYSSTSLWTWFRSKQMYDKFSFGASLHNVSLDENNKKHEFRIATAVKVHNRGPLIHFAYHITPDDYSLHLGSITPLSRHFDIYFGVNDLNINNFAAGGAVEAGPFEANISYDFKATKIYFSLMLRLGEANNALFQRYKEIGNQQIKDNNFAGALSAYKKALAYNPGDEDIIYLISVLRQDAGQTSQKIDSLVASGKSFEKRGWYINAFNTYQKILEIDRHNRSAHHRLKQLNPKLTPYLNQIFSQGVAYYNNQDLRRAELIFKQILQVDNNHQQAKLFLAKVDSINSSAADEYYYRGLGYYKQNNLTRARQEFKAALTFNPGHEQVKEYLDRTEREIATNNQLIENYLRDARNYEQTKQYVKAALSYRKILEIDKSHRYARDRLTYLDNHISKEIDEKFRRARRSYDRMNYSEAIIVLQEIFAIDPDHAASKNLLRRANQKIADLAQQHYERAQNFFNQNKWDIVLQECMLTLQMNPNHAAAKELQQMALANISLDKLIDKGSGFYQRGDYINARSTFKQVLAKEPNNATAQNYLTRIENDLKEQVEMLFNMGMVKYTEGDYDEAIKEWKKIFEIDPDHQSARDYIQKARERIDALKRIE